MNENDPISAQKHAQKSIENSVPNGIDELALLELHVAALEEAGSKQDLELSHVRAERDILTARLAEAKRQGERDESWRDSDARRQLREERDALAVRLAATERERDAIDESRQKYAKSMDAFLHRALAAEARAEAYKAALVEARWAVRGEMSMKAEAVIDAALAAPHENVASAGSGLSAASPAYETPKPSGVKGSTGGRDASSPTLADVQAWLRARPGSSWVATLDDINEALASLAPKEAPCDGS